jgi:hypothetical protein
VVDSKASDAPEGARVYGYFPAATHATLTVAGKTPTGFRVQRSLPPEFAFYDQYSVASRDPLFLPDREDLMVVMRPLFLTGVLLVDYLTVSEFMGADTVLVSSAASKTAYGMAAAYRRENGPKLVGLASAGSQAVAAQTGVYDSIVTYDDIAKLPASEAAVYVDIAGSGSVRGKLANHLGASLKLVLGVGLTHWKEGSFGATESLPGGGRSEMFFAPGWASKRALELGPAFFQKMGAGWQAQMADVGQHFKVIQKTGAVAVQESFTALAAGLARPDEAWVLSF